MWRAAVFFEGDRERWTCANGADFVDHVGVETCLKVHKTRAGAVQHAERLNRTYQSAALAGRWHNQKEGLARWPRLPAITPRARACLMASGPRWSTRGGWSHTTVYALAALGLAETAGKKIYRLTPYGVWARDRWIHLRFMNAPRTKK